MCTIPLLRVLRLVNCAVRPNLQFALIHASSCGILCHSRFSAARCEDFLWTVNPLHAGIFWVATLYHKDSTKLKLAAD